MSDDKSIKNYFNHQSLDIAAENNAKVVINTITKSRGDILDDAAIEFIFKTVKDTANKIADDLTNGKTIFAVVASLTIQYNMAIIFKYLRERGLAGD